MTELIWVQQSIFHHSNSISSCWQTCQVKQEDSEEKCKVDLRASDKVELDSTVLVENKVEKDLDAINEACSLVEVYLVLLEELILWLVRFHETIVNG